MNCETCKTKLKCFYSNYYCPNKCETNKPLPKPKSGKDISQYNYSNLNWRDFPVKRVNEDDFIGKRFGHLVVIKKPLKDNNLFTVQCDCGNMNIFQANHLTRGCRTTCGKDCKLERGKKNGGNK